MTTTFTDETWGKTEASRWMTRDQFLAIPPPTALERAAAEAVGAWGQIGVHAPNDRHWAQVRGHEYLDQAMAKLGEAIGTNRLHELVTIALMEEDERDAAQTG